MRFNTWWELQEGMRMTPVNYFTKYQRIQWQGATIRLVIYWKLDRKILWVILKRGGSVNVREKSIKEVQYWKDIHILLTYYNNILYKNDKNVLI